MEREKESVLPSVGEECIGGGGAYTLRRERGGVVKRDVDPYIIRVGIERKEREEVESSEKDRPCLTKVTTPPLAWVVSGERMPDREWVPSKRVTTPPLAWVASGERMPDRERVPSKRRAENPERGR